MEFYSDGFLSTSWIYLVLQLPNSAVIKCYPLLQIKVRTFDV